jgi:hypothetical protein
MDARKISLITVFAALYAAGSYYLPGFPLVGVPGSKIDATRALEIPYGLILGPLYGPAAAFLGAVIGRVLTGGNLFFTLPALVTPFVAATMGRRMLAGIRGWMIGAVVLLATIVGWYSTETGRAAPYYPVLHLAGLAVILIFRGRIQALINSGKRERVALGVGLCSFPSTLAGHMLGNLIYIILFNPSPLFFMSLLPVSAVERLVITVAATVVGAPLIIIVSKAYPKLIEAG